MNTEELVVNTKSKSDKISDANQYMLETGGIKTFIYSKALKEKIFPKLPDVKNISNLMLDEVGKYSITLPKTAEIITKLIKNHINNNSELKTKEIIITDATAGIGGNTISFAQSFYKVNAIEINYNRFLFLTNNINIYNLDNVSLFNKDFTKLISTLEQDILFIDPPWGGKNYKKKKNINISISGFALEDICLQFKNRTKIIVLKVPLNYNLEKFISILNANIYQYKIKKMYILIIEF